jgi:hypothetical protein
VPRSPSMMKLLKFLFRTLEEAEICRHLEGRFGGGKPKTAAELAEECGKYLKKVHEILDNKTIKGIIHTQEREEKPGVWEYFNVGWRGIRNTWGHVAKDDAEGLISRELENKIRLYVVSESGTIESLKKVDILKAMPLLSGGSIIIPSCC